MKALARHAGHLLEEMAEGRRRRCPPLTLPTFKIRPCSWPCSSQHFNHQSLSVHVMAVVWCFLSRGSTDVVGSSQPRNKADHYMLTNWHVQWLIVLQVLFTQSPPSHCTCSNFSFFTQDHTLPLDRILVHGNALTDVCHHLLHYFILNPPLNWKLCSMGMPSLRFTSVFWILLLWALPLMGMFGACGGPHWYFHCVFF